jgi:hypothetical protein
VDQHLFHIVPSDAAILDQSSYELIARISVELKLISLMRLTISVAVVSTPRNSPYDSAPTQHALSYAVTVNQAMLQSGGNMSQDRDGKLALACSSRYCFVRVQA